MVDLTNLPDLLKSPVLTILPSLLGLAVLPDLSDLSNLFNLLNLAILSKLPVLSNLAARDFPSERLIPFKNGSNRRYFLRVFSNLNRSKGSFNADIAADVRFERNAAFRFEVRNDFEPIIADRAS